MARLTRPLQGSASVIQAFLFEQSAPRPDQGMSVRQAVPEVYATGSQQAKHTFMTNLDCLEGVSWRQM